MEGIAETILAMRRQETSVYGQRDWLYQVRFQNQNFPMHYNMVDADCRGKIATWCFEVAGICNFSHETVEITLNLLDRFMLTPSGTSVRSDRAKYQLTSLAALYTAVKIHEPAAMDPQLVSRLSRGLYSPEEIVQMESTFVAALGWRLNPPSAHSFVRTLLQLVPSHVMPADIRCKVEKLCSFQIDLSVVDSRFLVVCMSTIAYASISNALETLGLDAKLIRFIRHIISKVLHPQDLDHVANVQSALYQAVLSEEKWELSTSKSAQSSTKSFRGASSSTSPRSVAMISTQTFR
jgi:hypothetical protein